MNADEGPTVVVLQPGYLPWLGFFDQMRRCDIFVLYDDAQFDKHGWRNRNRIKSPTGPHWLTVPVHVTLGQRILEIEVDNRQPWARKHVSTIGQFYAKAPYLKRYMPELEELLMGRRWERLIEVDVAVIELLCDWLGIEPRWARSSELRLGGERNEHLLNICRHFGARRYLSGNAAQSYLDTELFARHRIAVEWQNYHHPVYTQQHGEFLPFLSVMDLLLNCGEESASIIAGK